MISDAHIDYIINQINGSGIRSKSLKDDLIDHFCCLVEIEMNKGLHFEEAYQKAFHQTSPNGLDEIQDETLFLLNYNKIKNMKRFTYIVGYLFSLATTTGALFKLLHLPGAALLLMGGLTGLAFIFAPLILVNKLKSKINNILSEKLKWVFGVAGMMLLTTATTFKFLHLAGAGELLALAFMVIAFGFLPFFFFRMYKSDQAIAE